jgi:hypothetical protein
VQVDELKNRSLMFFFSMQCFGKIRQDVRYVNKQYLQIAAKIFTFYCNKPQTFAEILTALLLSNNKYIYDYE